MNFFFTSVAGFNVTVIYKNGFMRKFLFFALSAIFTAGTPAGCNTDYNAISYFVWVNDSDHKITLFVESDLGCEFKNEVILPGESFTAMDNGMGVCPVPSSYIWKMSYPPNYDAHYDPSIDDNYVFEDLRGNGRQPKERWTYVFTNADYDAAEAMVPFE